MLKGGTDGQHCVKVVFVLLLAGDVWCIQAAAAIAGLSQCVYLGAEVCAALDCWLDAEHRMIMALLFQQVFVCYCRPGGKLVILARIFSLILLQFVLGAFTQGSL